MKKWIKMGMPLILILVPAVSTATESTGMPWETPLQVIIDSLTGPVLRSAIILAIIITGLTLAFGENSSGFVQTCARVILGLAIACSASSWGLELFGFAGGLLF
jgi:type IV secretion system protein TrbC